jgi:putative peptidoglycan lipid II flippase
MKKTAFLIMIITIVSKLFGFVRDIVLSYVYGASNVSDAYLISMTIPSVIFGFIISGLVAGFIPLYTNILQKEKQIEANDFMNNIITILLIICTVIIAIVFPFAEKVVKLFASGFEGETLKLAVRLSKISMLAIYFTGVMTIYSGFLQVKNSYLIPALIGLPFNILIIVSIILSKKIDIIVLAIGFVVATASQLFILIPFTRRKGYKYKFKLVIKDKNIINLFNMALPVMLGLSVNQINTLVDRTLASSIVIGGISSLNYASKLTGFIQGIFVMSIVTVLYPKISKMMAEKDTSGIKTVLKKSIIGIMVIVLPATVGIMVLSKPLVTILFGRGAFNSEAVEMTANVLFYYSIGMIGYGLREVLSRVFYSMQNTKTPMYNAALGMTLNVILNIILSRIFGIIGLALATSISGIVTTLLLFMSLRREIGAIGMGSLFKSFIKLISASMLMGATVNFCFNYLFMYNSITISFFLSVLLGCIIYFFTVYLLKVEDFIQFILAIMVKLSDINKRGDHNQ